MVTKNDIYAFLTRVGNERGFCTIPEFSVRLPDGRIKKIDLVWANRREPDPNERAIHLQHWTLTAAFEIEGCNVPLRPEFNRHWRDFPHVANMQGEPIAKFVVLYTAAFDRCWRVGVNRDAEVAARLGWLTDGRFVVVDGRQIERAVADIP